MILNMLKKVIIQCVVLTFVFSMPTMLVHAQDMYETEPNNTFESAEIIQANFESAEDAINGKRPNQFCVNGYTDQEDEDWYKVYLSVGTQYITCNGDGFNFNVYDENTKLLMSNSYVKSGFGSTAYPFNVSKAGYYYVKIYGSTSTSKSYILLVGGPSYAVAKCTVNLGNVTMKSGIDSKSRFTLGKNEVLPNDSKVYQISMSSIGSNYVSGIAVKNLKTNKNINLRKYSWDKSELLSLNMPLQSDWEIKYSYSTDKTFSSKIKFFYVYPVTSTYVQDKIINVY